jgi:hypothetical protein
MVFIATDRRAWSLTLAGLFCGNAVLKSTTKDLQQYTRLDDGSFAHFANSGGVYLKLADQVENITRNQSWIYKSSYDQATVIQKASWFKSRRLCKEKCCVETVAISLNQDDTKLINWRSDHHDLADITIHKFVTDDGITTFGTNFNESMIPCLVPGTIIAVDNYEDALQYFWFQVRPQIKVPYVLLTSSADQASPIQNPTYMADYIGDPLLIQWYATNPTYHVQSQIFQSLRDEKFQPMLSGLSYLHPQHRYLTAYLQLTNFSNPFKGKDWNSLANSHIDFDRDIFVHFGLRRQPHRRPMWNALCESVNRTDPNRVSCNQNTRSIPLHLIYKEMSTAKFGISPPGMGYDCYRVYELLFLGVIPVVFDKGEESHDLYQGLPIIQMPLMDQAKTRDDYVEFIINYIRSARFQNATADFEKGWERLFMRHKRRQVLQKANRIKEIIHDPQGHEYYQGYKYTPDNAGSPIYCHNLVDNCALREDARRHTSWLQIEEGRQVDEEWIVKWNQLEGTTIYTIK